MASHLATLLIRKIGITNSTKLRCGIFGLASSSLMSTTNFMKIRSIFELLNEEVWLVMHKEYLKITNRSAVNYKNVACTNYHELNCSL